MKINITISQETQNAICERCPLADCIGIESRECPIQVEQRATWRNQNHLRKAAGYFSGRAARIKAARAAASSSDTWFKDSLQWLTAAFFNLLLFIAVGANTILDYNLANGAPLSSGMLLYLRGGIVGSFLLAFAMWEVLIHLDPVNKRRKAKGSLELRAENALHEFEVMIMEFEIEKRADDLEYERKLHQQMHARRLRATESETVEAALDTYESQEADEKAKRIRGVHNSAGAISSGLGGSSQSRQAVQPQTWGGNGRGVLD